MKEGQKTTVWLNKKNYKELKLLAIKQDSTMQALINEFIKDGLKKYNVKI